MNHLLGVDVGTTSIKVSIFTQDGKWVGSQSRDYSILIPEIGFAEQDPNDWWSGFLSACEKLQTEHTEAFNSIVGVGLCGQMHTQVYLDDHFQSLRPAITWMDQRSSKIVERIKANYDARKLNFPRDRK